MKPTNKAKIIVDEISKEIVSKLTPLEIGKILYPEATPVKYPNIPEDIKKEHLTRYKEKELQDGQFFEILQGKYTFIMSQESHSIRNLEKSNSEN